MEINGIKIHCKHDKLLNVDDFVPHELNTNKHPDKQIEVLAKLLKRNGVRLPIIISNLSSKCVSGHGRHAAFKLLGMDKIPVVYQDFETVSDEYRFLESDNHIAEFAEHDKEQMLSNLTDLDIDLTDFDFEEVGLIDFRMPDLNDLDDGKEFDESCADDVEYLECPSCKHRWAK